MNYGLQFVKISDGFYKRWLLKRAAGICDLTELQDRKKILIYNLYSTITFFNYKYHSKSTVTVVKLF